MIEWEKFGRKQVWTNQRNS